MKMAEDKQGAGRWHHAVVLLPSQLAQTQAATVCATGTRNRDHTPEGTSGEKTCGGRRGEANRRGAGGCCTAHQRCSRTDTKPPTTEAGWQGYRQVLCWEGTYWWGDVGLGVCHKVVHHGNGEVGLQEAHPLLGPCVLNLAAQHSTAHNPAHNPAHHMLVMEWTDCCYRRHGSGPSV